MLYAARVETNNGIFIFTMKARSLNSAIEKTGKVITKLFNYYRATELKTTELTSDGINSLIDAVAWAGIESPFAWSRYDKPVTVGNQIHGNIIQAKEGIGNTLISY